MTVFRGIDKAQATSAESMGLSPDTIRTVTQARSDITNVFSYYIDHLVDVLLPFLSRCGYSILPQDCQLGYSKRLIHDDSKGFTAVFRVPDADKNYRYWCVTLAKRTDGTIDEHATLQLGDPKDVTKEISD